MNKNYEKISNEVFENSIEQLYNSLKVFIEVKYLKRKNLVYIY